MGAEENVCMDCVSAKKDGIRLIALSDLALEIVVAMEVVQMANASAKRNGLDHIALSNRHQNAKKPVLHPAKRMPQRAMKVPILDKFVSRIVLRRIVTLKNSTFVVFHQWKRW